MGLFSRSPPRSNEYKTETTRGIVRLFLHTQSQFTAIMADGTMKTFRVYESEGEDGRLFYDARFVFDAPPGEFSVDEFSVKTPSGGWWCCKGLVFHVNSPADVNGAPHTTVVRSEPADTGAF